MKTFACGVKKELLANGKLIRRKQMTKQKENEIRELVGKLLILNSEKPLNLNDEGNKALNDLADIMELF